VNPENRVLRPYIEAALLVALALVLSGFTIYRAPMGGSVTLGSTIPVCIVGLRSGPKVGLLAGLNFGILSFLTSGVLIGLGPFVMDYLIAFSVLGLTGFFRSYPLISILLVQLLRLFCHVVSGVLYFSQGKVFAEALNYSLLYNASFLIPDVILGLVFFTLLKKRSPDILKA